MADTLDNAISAAKNKVKKFATGITDKMYRDKYDRGQLNLALLAAAEEEEAKQKAAEQKAAEANSMANFQQQINERNMAVAAGASAPLPMTGTYIEGKPVVALAPELAPSTDRPPLKQGYLNTVQSAVTQPTATKPVATQETPTVKQSEIHPTPYVKPIFKSRFAGGGNYSTSKVTQGDLVALADLPKVDPSQSISAIGSKPPVSGTNQDEASLSTVIVTHAKQANYDEYYAENTQQTVQQPVSVNTIKIEQSVTQQSTVSQPVAPQPVVPQPVVPQPVAPQQVQSANSSLNAESPAKTLPAHMIPKKVNAQSAVQPASVSESPVTEQPKEVAAPTVVHSVPQFTSALFPAKESTAEPTKAVDTVQPEEPVKEQSVEPCYYILLKHTKTYPAKGSLVMMRSCDHEYAWTNEQSEAEKPSYKICPGCGKPIEHFTTEME